MYGSSANGLAVRGSSDIDICLKIKEECPTETLERVLTERVLKSIRNRKECYESKVVEFSEPMGFPTTFGEIVNLKVSNKQNKEEFRSVGICLEDPLTLPIRDLVLTYVRLEPRFHKLALVLKYWNQKSFGKGDKRMLVSHAIVLMTIAYL